MNQNQNQSRAIIVPASAGSGKTFRIAQEYIYDVLRNRYTEEGKPYFDSSFYKRILAVTFTNKATEEMKSRILKEIHLLASWQDSDHLSDLKRKTSLTEKELRDRAKIVRSLILHDYSHFTVLTNDTFFQRILRAFVRELGVDMNFSTELDTAPVLAKSVDALIEDIVDDKNKELRDWLEGITSDRIKDGQRWNIRDAITALTGELFKESTREVIAQCKDKKALKKSIDDFEAVVDEKREVFKAMGSQALDAIGKRGYSHDNFIYKFTKIFEKVADATLDKVSARDMAHLTDSTTEWFGKGKSTPDLLALADELQTMWVDIYSYHLELQTLENTLHILRYNYRGFALLRDLQSRVERVCRDDNSMLLSDTKHIISSFISESETPFIYERVGNYFDKFMIDEFQDTSAKEWNNFLPLLRNAMAQSLDTSVLIVGDVKQSIYRWRGGDWRILGNEVMRQLPESKSDPLGNNWRSLPNIVKFNEKLFDEVIEGENGRLNALLDEADGANRISKECKADLYNTLEKAYTGHGQVACRKHTNKGYISIVAAAEGVTDDEGLVGESGMPLYVEHIKSVLERGFKPCDITILVRTRGEGMEIAEELLSYRNRLPKEFWFEITTEEALRLAASPAVKLIIAVMRLAVNRGDVTSLIEYHHLHNNNNFGSKLSEAEHRFLDSIRSMSPEDAFEAITIEYADDLEGQTAYLLALHEQILRFSTGKVADLTLFDKWWSDKCEGLSVRVERSEQAIEILTIHKAKGLENRVVMIPRCSWPIDPKSSSGYISNVVWSQPAPHKHLSDIGKFPVAFNGSVAKSLFADAYFREMVYASVDALNLLYVATTRAKEQLHIFLTRKTRGYNIDALLRAVYDKQLQRVEGFKYCKYEIGVFDGPEPKSGESKEPEVKSVVLDEHRVSPVLLKLRTSTSRYFSDEEVAISPRDMGIRLHRAFETASTRDEIFENLNSMTLGGELSTDEANELREKIESVLNTTVAGEWFDGSWERLYCERKIVSKRSEQEATPNFKSKRPDRVMTRGKEAVVVDYKFGRENNGHKEQIEHYMSVLGEMGYSSIKGYIWYVSQEKIIQI